MLISRGNRRKIMLKHKIWLLTRLPSYNDHQNTAHAYVRLVLVLIASMNILVVMLALILVLAYLTSVNQPLMR